MEKIKVKLSTKFRCVQTVRSLVHGNDLYFSITIIIMSALHERYEFCGAKREKRKAFTAKAHRHTQKQKWK